MNYRNRGQRCRHGMLLGVIDCPGCEALKLAQKRGGRYHSGTSQHRQVLSKRDHGDAREQRVRGYTS